MPTASPRFPCRTSRCFGLLTSPWGKSTRTFAYVCGMTLRKLTRNTTGDSTPSWTTPSITSTTGWWKFWGMAIPRLWASTRIPRRYCGANLRNAHAVCERLMDPARDSQGDRFASAVRRSWLLPAAGLLAACVACLAAAPLVAPAGAQTSASRSFRGTARRQQVAAERGAREGIGGRDGRAGTRASGAPAARQAERWPFTPSLRSSRQPMQRPRWARAQRWRWATTISRTTIFPTREPGWTRLPPIRCWPTTPSIGRERTTAPRAPTKPPSPNSASFVPLTRTACSVIPPWTVWRAPR